jgi:hypothetical protein
MREKSLLIDWADKGHDATIISAKMENHFESSPPSCSWITKWLRALKSSKDIFKPCERSGRPQDPLTGLRVLEFLNSTPSVSIRQIATATKMLRSTVLDYLKEWNYTLLYLKWIPYHLTMAMMEQPVGDPGQRLVLHMDKASPHRARFTTRNLKENRITASPHPAFSPDLAPSDFFLFSALKGSLSGRIFESPDELVEATRELASAITRTTLEREFLEWEERLQRCIDITGVYVD